MSTSTDSSKTGLPSNKTVQRILTGVNINSAGSDVAITGLPSKYRITKFTPYDASANLSASLATLGLFTAAAGGGTALVVAALLTVLSAVAKFLDMTLAVPSDYRTEASLFVNNVVAHGSAATVSILFEYIDLS